MRYGEAELNVLVVVKPQTFKVVAIPAPTTFGECMETLDVIPGK